MKVKICGLSTAEQVKTSISLGANFCGFILNYPKSHRFIQFEKAKELTNIEKKNSKYVGVLVEPKNDELEKFSKLKEQGIITAEEFDTKKKELLGL